jgi:hypothetical protein
MHLRYAPTDLELELGGTDIKERCPTSEYSFDWNVTHRPSQSGICPDWFGDKSFAMRERGICAGLSTPKHCLWSRTNCSVVTASFSQFKTVALSMLPLFGDEHAAKIRNSGKYLILMKDIII